MSVKGDKEEALGARIRMKCAMVGAICPTLMGEWTISGRTFHPIRIKGDAVYTSRITLVSSEWSRAIVHPGNTSTHKSPEQALW